ncbi:hypothetical protein KCP71_06140 [Salmonella enterica subsp. enterica]|nr:hypothetical protein KCP71_06140 [Salmonella enterica subsp. enterica]
MKPAKRVDWIKVETRSSRRGERTHDHPEECATDVVIIAADIGELDLYRTLLAKDSIAPVPARR